MGQFTVTWETVIDRAGGSLLRGRLPDGREIRIERPADTEVHHWAVAAAGQAAPLAWGTARRLEEAEARAMQALAVLGSAA